MKNKLHIFLFVLIIAVFLLAFQYMFRSFRGEDFHAGLVTNFLVNLPACIVIGAIDFWIIHTVYKKNKSRNKTVRIAIDLSLTALFAIVSAVIADYMVSAAGSFGDNILKTSLPLVLWNSIIVLLIEIFFYNQRQVEAEKKLAVIEKEKAQYQYEMLKAQINPHFLFNSLNVLSSLAYKDAEKTNLFAKKMSGMYRYLLLTNDRTTVTLKEELAFLESYIFLEKIRFENALTVEITGSDSSLNRQLIPVSLQLLAENAIKHNVATVKRPLAILVDITDEGITVSNTLQLRNSVDKGGMGLKYLQKQYSLYHQTIDVNQTGTEFIVKIPFVE